jgi:hypothetical protein
MARPCRNIAPSGISILLFDDGLAMRRSSKISTIAADPSADRHSAPAL